VLQLLLHGKHVLACVELHCLTYWPGAQMVLQDVHTVLLEVLQTLDEYLPDSHTEQFLHALGNWLSVVRAVSLYVLPFAHDTQLPVCKFRKNPTLQSRGHPFHDRLNCTG
jgi:hypothetical protein